MLHKIVCVINNNKEEQQGTMIETNKVVLLETVKREELNIASKKKCFCF